MNRNCAKHDISVLIHSTFDLKQLQRAKNIWHFVSLFCGGCCELIWRKEVRFVTWWFYGEKVQTLTLRSVYCESFIFYINVINSEIVWQTINPRGFDFFLQTRPSKFIYDTVSVKKIIKKYIVNNICDTHAHCHCSIKKSTKCIVP